ncbi:MAG: GxxExxY protein [Candidatus Stahlbacteria bacterium]|nr:MAG: GxxExxY protein [Candidatus Stahlbacteria bacterium]
MNISHRGTENTERFITDIKELNKITEKIIGCAIEVHRNLGPGLLESIYESALCVEFDNNDIEYQRQILIPVRYKDNIIGEHKLDLLVENEIIVELKAIDKMAPIFEAQLLSYLKMAKKKLGLLINFNSIQLKEGLKRIIL